MRVPPDRADETTRWFEYASHDLVAARLIFERRVDPIIAAYHAQQCAEKAIKGVLTGWGVEFSFTHSISILRELAARHGGIAGLTPDADALTYFATTARYPGVGNRVTFEQACSMVRLGDGVLVACIEALRGDGFPVPKEFDPRHL